MKKLNYYKDNENGLYHNEERSMQDLVANKIIKWYTEIREDEFKTLLKET